MTSKRGPRTRRVRGFFRVVAFAGAAGAITGYALTGDTGWFNTGLAASLASLTGWAVVGEPIDYYQESTSG